MKRRVRIAMVYRLGSCEISLELQIQKLAGDLVVLKYFSLVF